MTISANPLTILLLLPWAALWLAGGVWLARAAFRLPRGEQFIIGISIGWIGENWLANLLAQVVPVKPEAAVPLAFWAAAGLIFAGGLLAVGLRFGWRELLRWEISLPQVLILAGLVFVFYSIARGTAIFDDFNHVSTASVMATGDIPPHFVLDPQVLYGYHHFLLLFSAQLIRLGSFLPWVAVDASRSISFGLAVLLAGLFTRRLTRSLVGGVLGGAMMAFGSGTRWLLLLLPPALLNWLSKSVHLIGSGAGSGASFADSLTKFWAVEGAGPVPFPFAFANGIVPPGVVQANAGNGLVGFVIIFLLLLTFHYWRNNWLGAALSAMLIAVWGLLGEAELPGIAAGWGIVALAYLITCKPRPLFRWRSLPRGLWAWLGVMGAGVLVGVLEGGTWTDIITKMVEKLLGHPTASYQTIGFAVSLPAVISSHLGVLPVLNPATLVVGLFELGPLLLVFPLLVAFGIKAFRLGRWYEAATAATAVVMVLALFVQFTGSTGVRNTPRLYVFMPLLTVFAVPLVWMWAERRSATVKALAASLGLITVMGGIVMFGVELIAAQRPVTTYYLTALDVRMMRGYWNQLEPGALVFDQVPYRAPTIFGRPTDASYTWYQSKPEWEALRAAPDPAALNKAGFSYIYMDDGYWGDLTPQVREALSAPCVKLAGEAADDQGKGFRRLLDVRQCH